MPYYFYIARCADESLYCGICTDPFAREAAHNGEGRGGAKYTRSRRPVRIVHQEAFESKGDALKREAAVKKWSKAQKEELLAL